ncbi:MAG: hypothetical protein JXR37_32480 [Kiritimatiellae bacterium]|nr:hypothetical protein [Kiritimatiellia bacterium]
MKRLVVWSMAGVLSAAAALAGPTLNYQGRVTAGGGNFTGEGYFKFVLFNDEECLWSNDGSPGTNEPGSSVNVSVNNGLFTVELGESPMNAIPPLALHAWQVELRTWFSTNDIAFQLLWPDTRIRPIDFSQIDTHGTVLVASDGTADFDDLQAAIDCVATNDQFQHILVMPGHYELSAPLTFPTNEWITIRGVGSSRESVTVENTNGVTIAPYDVYVENMKFQGRPAVSTESLPGEFNVELRNCYIGLSDDAAGPAAVFTGEGRVELFECYVQADGQAPCALALSGGLNAYATHTRFDCWAADAVTLVVTDYTGYSEFESCKIDADETVPGLYISGGGGHCVFRSCEISGLLVSNANVQTTFEECRLRGDRPAQFVESMRGAWLRNCDMVTTSNTAFFAQDSSGEFRVKGCNIHGHAGHAVEAIATESFATNHYMGLRFDGCYILSIDGDGGDKDAINITCAGTGGEDDDYGASVAVWDCEVCGYIRDGIHSEGAEVEVQRSDVDGERYAVYGAGGDIEVSAASMEGGEACIRASGACEVHLRDTELWSDRWGLYASLDGQIATLIGCHLEAMMEPALECEGGRYLAERTLFIAGTNAAVLLKGATTAAIFNNCSLFSIADLFGATNTAPMLVLSDSTQVPAARLTGCLLETGSQAPYAIGLSGGATTGNLFMAHSGLTTNIAPEIGLIAPEELPYGNYLMPPGLR